MSWLRGLEDRVSILIVGNAVVDIAYRIRRLPRPGETLLASARTMDVGGKELNQAVAARRAGAEVQLVTPVGRDEPARHIRNVLAREGLDPALLVTVDTPTDKWVIWVAEDGENVIVSTAAAAQGLRPADVAAVGDLGPADTLLMQGNLTLETIARCLEAARGSGARIVVNTAPGCRGGAAGRDGQRARHQRWRGSRALESDRTEAAAEALSGRGPGSVVVTRGAAGAHLLIGDRHHSLPAPEVTTVDTTGAGDELVGVLAAALDAGLDFGCGRLGDPCREPEGHSPRYDLRLCDFFAPAAQAWARTTVLSSITHSRSASAAR